MKRQKKSEKHPESEKSFFLDPKNSEVLHFYRRITPRLLSNIYNLRQYFVKRASKEVSIFSKSNLSFSFNPLLVLQGAAVFVFLIFFLFALANLFISRPQISETQIIKDITIKQTSAAIAGQPVKWTVIVKRSQINENQHLVQLPKTAKNIKAKTISAKDAEIVLAKTIPQASTQLTAKERQKLVQVSRPPSFFLASILSRISRFFLSSVEDAINSIVEQITQEVIITDEAKLVDVSKQEVKQEEKEQKKEEKQPSSASAEATAGKEEKEIKEETKEEAPSETTPDVVQTPSEEQPAEDAMMSDVAEATSDIAPTPSLLEVVELLEAASPSDQPVIEMPQEPLLETVSPSDQEVGGTSDIPPTTTEAEAEEQKDEFVEIDYETPAPEIEITEQETDKGKLVTVSSPEQPADQPQLTDVLAYTTIPEIFKVGQEKLIKIKWRNNEGQKMPFTAYDLNNNGKIDYLEWTVPHLSDQIFEIIFISKAFELDENKEIINDIYDLVKTQDNQWATVPAGHYIRVTFEQTLDNTRDNTIYAKPTENGSPSTIEVYPVYTDAGGNQTEGPLVATFENIDHEDTYKVLLTNLQTPTDVFDLKIVSGGLTPVSLDIDYIVDPTPPSGAPSVTEPVNSSSTGNLQTIIGTPNATTQSTSTLFNYLRLLENRIGTVAEGVAENATDTGKLEDLLGTSAAALDRVTIFDYIHKIYTALANLAANVIKNGTVIGGLTGTLNYRLTDTGQAQCYDATVATACNDSNWPRQDADTDGNSSACAKTPTQYTVGTYTTIDNCDGLEWQLYGYASSDGYTAPTQAGPPYTDGNCASGGTYVAGTPNACKYNWQDSLKYCANLSMIGNDGQTHTDWRLPNINELLSIMIPEAGVITNVKNSGAPYINTITGFSSTVSYSYWSSTTTPSTTTYALSVSFTNGNASPSNKISAYYVRCVRGQ